MTHAEPFVSVVTPFYDTAPYLAECIESVLAQTHGTFEYLLVDNRSTDGSREIAEAYARRDPRIRVIQNERFVGQVENYNGALEHVSPRATWVKVVQADDAIYPECLERMISLGQSERSIGLVSSYYVEGDDVSGGRVPRNVSVLPGREACRRMLLECRSMVGSPTTVLYRGDLVRARRPFYTPGRYHEDTEAAYEILLEHDLGFVHQVLSYSRRGNPSILESLTDKNPYALDLLMQVERFGPRVLSPDELAALRRAVHGSYFRFLGRAALRLRERAFWDYHRRGLTSVGLSVGWLGLARHAAAEAFRLGLDPVRSTGRALGLLRRRARAMADDRRAQRNSR